jgi:hypothetical protein
MQLLKEKILFKPNQSQNIQIFIAENTSFNGLQEDIDDFVAVETGLSINDVEDKETFRYLPESANTLNIFFFSGGTYDDTYEYAGFTSGETTLRDEVILRSFYLMQVYDLVIPEKQTLLHTGYFNGFNFININNTGTTYTYDSDTEFSNLYIPQWFIETLSGQTTTLYGKISFFNAKTGSLQLFSITPSASYVEPNTDADLYLEINLNPTGFTYSASTTTYGFELQNIDYVEKINNTLDVFDNEKPTYPTGNTFLNTPEYVES